MSNPLSLVSPWYQEGLRFECTGCGKCCTGAPGYTWVSEEEIINMAEFLKISLDEFSRLYLRKVGGRISLREDPRTFDCVFLKGNQCSLYSVRPIQCQTFPWWPSNLKSRKDWIEAAKRCEGIQQVAPLVPLDVIEAEKKRQENSLA